MNPMDAMKDMKIPVEVDPNEDTEWNDILRQHGVIPEKPPSPTQELENALDEAIKKQHDNRLENKDLDELEELEDEEDEDFLNTYKQKRLQEIQQLQSKAKFGQVFTISKNEYEDEVTKQSDEAYVFLHIASDSQLQSRLLGSIFKQLAPKFPEIKFVEIPSKRAIENYPELNVPTLLIYKNKQVLKQYITLTELGGNSSNIKDLEKLLVDYNAVDYLDKRLLVNQDDEDDPEFSSNRLKFKSKAIKEDDSDDDFYD